MKLFKHWKALALTALLPLLIALQPVAAYACGSGTHTGC